ncbi:MAG: AAA family ATPase [Microscillaceae bacterium]|nr:AAA family ATPase [Microscillaceae bacterium]
MDESFYGGRELTLTDKGVELLFADDVGIMEKSKNFNPKNCIVFDPDKIKPTNLFFNPNEEEQIGQISKLIQEENYQKARQKFQAHGLPPGLTVLFYGDPGTGKTQVAYNLAQASQRLLLMVDIAAIRDKYVGESEKRIKQIFKTYRKACEHHDLHPILFFNESDALISKRYEVNSSVDQMNNSMQNILLQELEDFQGILIATSNLNMNLDTAFERRFLYKVAFQKPELTTRLLIWKDKMPELLEIEIKALAEEFALTGGQINNICRKYLLSHILNDDTPELEELRRLCEREYFGRAEAKPLGF